MNKSLAFVLSACMLLMAWFESSGQAFALPQPYLCTAAGTEMVYVRRYVEDGDISRPGDVKWRHVMRFVSVDTVAGGGLEVNYTSQLFKSSGRGITSEPMQVTAEITRDGEVEIDIGVTMVSVMRGVLGRSVNITATGEKTLLPPLLNPGDTLPDASCVISALGMKMRISVSERHVTGYEEIDTPAGKYYCAVISEHKVEKGMMRNRVTTARTWYCRGIGMVRHDTYDKDGVLETSEVMTELRPFTEK